MKKGPSMKKDRRSVEQRQRDYHEGRNRGLGVSAAALRAGVSRSTGSRYERERLHTSKPKRPEAAKVPGVPPDPHPATWSEEVQEVEAQDPTEDDHAPVAGPVGQLSFAFDDLTPEEFAASLAKIGAPQPQDDEPPPARPTVVQGERGLTFPGGPSIQDAAPETRPVFNASGDQLVVKRIHGITGKEIPFGAQVPNSRFSISPPKKSMRGLWIGGPGSR